MAITLACFSDLHTQQTLIDCPLEQVRLRGRIYDTARWFSENAPPDALILLGDYTSDIDGTLPEENWYSFRARQHAALQGTFSGIPGPILYNIGNHDFECAKKMPYCCGDYHTGLQQPDDCFYEQAEDGTRLLAAWHERVCGIDFVSLNCGKNFYRDAWCYRHTSSPYSDESVDWVCQKISACNQRSVVLPVFFLCHIPFSDAKGISNRNKGMDETLPGSNSTAVLRKALSQGRNIFFLYGHDHGTDSAFYRADIAERLDRFGGCTAVFCGSLRYYANSIDGWVNERASRIVQALRLDAGEDSVKMTIENIGESGQFGDISVAPIIRSATVFLQKP